MTGRKKTNNAQDELVKEISALQEEQSKLNPVVSVVKPSKVQNYVSSSPAFWFIILQSDNTERHIDVHIHGPEFMTAKKLTSLIKN